MIARLRQSYRSLRLGTRLALGLGALALVVFAVVGNALTMYMRDYLSAQLNEQLKIAQIAQSKSIADYGTLKGKKYYRWYYAVYDTSSGAAPVLRKPEDPGDLPKDIDDFTLVAKALTVEGTEVTRTEHLKGQGQYRLRACEVEPGVILVSAAPMDDIEDTVGRLITVQVVTFALALMALVVFGRAMLRRGLKPLSDMAHTARGITSHDLTDSARLPVRHDNRDGGPEVEELRTAFNTMLEHIDDALAVRTEAEQRLRRFVADASHELRTPLMSVRGYADLFQYAAAHSPEERDKHLARLRAEAARMGYLLDDLLMLARLDAADVETPLRLEDADLVRLAHQAGDAFRAGHPGHPLTITTGSSPISLRLDPLRLRQVLDNLLTNAAVHTPPGTKVCLEVVAEPGGVESGGAGGGRAEPTAGATGADGTAAAAGDPGTAGSAPAGAGTVEVRITDSGPGIPADDQERVFDRFYRVDKARSRDRGGSGLGLAVARSLVRAHGGTITLTSEPGTTTFTVRLPLDGGRV